MGVVRTDSAINRFNRHDVATDGNTLSTLS